MNIWDFWATKYNRLWVQKYSLTPTREYILKILDLSKVLKILDLGCGPGELIEELFRRNSDLNITGLDYSEGMLRESRKKNHKAKHIHMDVADLHNLKEKYDIIISTHSIPYWKHPEKVMEDLSNILEDNGVIYLGFASGDSFYDKLALFFVKFTTGPANYPSHKKFRQFVSPYFTIEDRQVIKEKNYMPTIAVYTLRKVKS